MRREEGEFRDWTSPLLDHRQGPMKMRVPCLQAESCSKSAMRLIFLATFTAATCLRRSETQCS